ncbi:hypothetical protein P3342_003262 [Pyrenophora teres f. teres]|nr:hypothetical protein P3342_003262 [Pyrenophora teres f. teres]
MPYTRHIYPSQRLQLLLDLTMPAIRLTVASNTNQSEKAPIVIPACASPDPAAPSSIQTLVLKTAQSKLRMKKPIRVFVGRTGQELLTEKDWKTCIANDLVLLVSSGEEFVGIKRESNVQGKANPDCPVELLASKAPVESLSVTQLTTTAHTLPGIVHAVGQPDLHPGTKFPIGAVFASKKWIHPPLIGGDIGCGMAWYKTTLSRKQIDSDKGKKVADKLRGLEGVWRTQAYRQVWLLDEQLHDCSAGEQWDNALGTIGAGNHFAELQVVEASSLDNLEYGLHKDDVVLLVHSGSRGYGGSVLKKYTTEARTSFEDDSADAIEYLKEHDKACQWAKANRDLIALRFLSCLEPGNECWGLGSANAADFGDDWMDWQSVLAHRVDLLRSMLPLPGSRGTPTLILQPTFSASTSWGLKNGLSLAHGAGRAMSRTKALSTLAQKYKDQNILEPRLSDPEGTWVICDEKDVVFEEAPDAYKDVEAVGQDLADAGAANIVGWCRARISYKVRNETR